MCCQHREIERNIDILYIRTSVFLGPSRGEREARGYNNIMEEKKEECEVDDNKLASKANARVVPSEEDILSQFFVALNQTSEDVVYSGVKRFLGHIVKSTAATEGMKEKEERGPRSSSVLLELYLEQSPECREILDLLAGLSQGNTSKLYVSLLKLYGVIISRMKDSTKAAKISRALLRTQTKRFYASLSSKSMPVVKATLKLFATVVSRSPACAQVLYQHVDIQHKYFPALLGANIGKGRGGGQGKKKGATPASRGTMMYLVTSLLRCGASNVQRGIFCARAVVSAALSGLHRDAIATVRRFLDALGTVMIRERSIGRRTKLYILNVRNAQHVVKLLAGTAMQQDVAARFLRRLLLPSTPKKSSASTGVVSDDEVVLRVLLGLNPVADVRQRRILFDILCHRPDLVRSYTRKLSCSLEPKLGVSYLSSAAVVTRLLSLPNGGGGGNDGDDGSSFAISSLPRSLTRASLSRGLQHPKRLVRFAAAQLLLALLNAPASKEAGEKELRRVCPEPQIILSLLTSSANADDHEGNDAWIQERAMCVLRRYVYLLPVVMASLRFDWRRLVVTKAQQKSAVTHTLSSSSYVSLSRELELVRLLKVVGPARCQWLRAKGALGQGLLRLIENFVRATKRASAGNAESERVNFLLEELRKNYRTLLLDTLLYEYPLLLTHGENEDDARRRVDEASVFLDELDDSKSSASFLARTVVRVTANPFDESVVAFAQKNRLSALAASFALNIDDDVSAYASRVLLRIFLAGRFAMDLTDLRSNVRNIFCKIPSTAAAASALVKGTAQASELERRLRHEESCDIGATTLCRTIRLMMTAVLSTSKSAVVDDAEGVATMCASIVSRSLRNARCKDERELALEDLASCAFWRRELFEQLRGSANHDDAARRVWTSAVVAEIGTLCDAHLSESMRSVLAPIVADVVRMYVERSSSKNGDSGIATTSALSSVLLTWIHLLTPTQVDSIVRGCEQRLVKAPSNVDGRCESLSVLSGIVVRFPRYSTRALGLLLSASVDEALPLPARETAASSAMVLLSHRPRHDPVDAADVQLASFVSKTVSSASAQRGARSLALVEALSRASPIICRTFVCALTMPNEKSIDNDDVIVLPVAMACFAHVAESTSDRARNIFGGDDERTGIFMRRLVSTVVSASTRTMPKGGSYTRKACVALVRVLVATARAESSPLTCVVFSKSSAVLRHLCDAYANVSIDNWTSATDEVARAVLVGANGFESESCDAVFVRVLERVINGGSDAKYVAESAAFNASSRKIVESANNNDCSLVLRIARATLRSCFDESWALRVVRVVLERSSAPEGDSLWPTLWSMLIGHSSFLPLLSSKKNDEDESSVDGDTHDARLQLLSLMSATLARSPKRCCCAFGESQALRVVRCFLAAYDASMSESDRLLLGMIRTFEAHAGVGPASLDYRWGSAALVSSANKVSSSSTIGERDFSWLFEDGQLHQRRLRVRSDRVDEAYDPRFLLPMLVHVFETVGSVPLRKLVDTGILGYVVVALSSPDLENVRRPAYEVLGRFYQQLQLQQTQGLLAGGFSERPQVQLLLDCLQKAIEKPFFRVPSLMGVFVAESLSLLLRPGHAVYPQLNGFLLARPSLDLTDVPLFYNLFNSGRPTYRAERMWMLRLLVRGVRSDIDHALLARRHVFTVLMSFYESALGGEKDIAAQRLVRTFFERVSTIPACVDHLLRRSGVGSWLTGLLRRQATRIRTNGSICDDDVVAVFDWIARVARSLLETSRISSESSLLESLAKEQLRPLIYALVETTRETKALLRGEMLALLESMTATSTPSSNGPFLHPACALRLASAIDGNDKGRGQRVFLKMLTSAVSPKEAVRSHDMWFNLSQRVIECVVSIARASSSLARHAGASALVESALAWLLDAALQSVAGSKGFVSAPAFEVATLQDLICGAASCRIVVTTRCLEFAESSSWRSEALRCLAVGNDDGVRRDDESFHDAPTQASGMGLFYLNSLLLLTLRRRDARGYAPLLEACEKFGESLPSPASHREYARSLDSATSSLACSFVEQNEAISAEIARYLAHKTGGTLTAPPRARPNKPSSSPSNGKKRRSSMPSSRKKKRRA